MSKSLITPYLRLHAAKQFQESVSETANSVYYIFAGKHTSYAEGDATVPDITSTVENFDYTAYDEMVFGCRVTPSDISIMTDRYDWQANTKYAAYRSGDNLSGSQFFVGVEDEVGYHVFKCLDNASNGYSTVAPDVTATSPDDEFYSTSDGYVWKYMYSISSANMDKFATADYIPVIANSQVVGNAVSGAVDTVVVTYGGSNYNTYLANTFLSSDIAIGGDTLKYTIANNASSSNNFYVGSFIYLTNGTGSGQGKRIVGYTVIGTDKTITLASAFDTRPDSTTQYEITPAVTIEGDGAGAEVRALVNTSSSNSIYAVEIISRGNSYTWATGTVTGNTGGTTNTATVSVVLGPKNGHGSNPEAELNASVFCMSVDFANNLSGTIPVQNDYRVIGVLKDPLFANVVFTVGSPSGNFTVGETVVQANTGAQGVVVAWDSINQLQLANCNGVFLTGNTTVNYLTGQTSDVTSSVLSYQNNGASKNFNTFDQRHRFTYTPIDGTFTPDEAVYQTDIQLVNAVFHSTYTYGSNSMISFTSLRGALNTGNTITGNTSGATANLLFHYPPDLVVGSGEVLYLENKDVVTRSNTQTETVKVILHF